MRDVEFFSPRGEMTEEQKKVDERVNFLIDAFYREPNITASAVSSALSSIATAVAETVNEEFARQFLKDSFEVIMQSFEMNLKREVKCDD